jgi:AmmeMemoRadiSam system protein B
VAQTLPRLRLTLDFLPSPSQEHPGLLIRDPYRYSDALLVIPPVLLECLPCFDGTHTDLDLRAALVRATSDLNVGELQQQLVGALSSAGFLEDGEFLAMKQRRTAEFAAMPVRALAHAGGAYPADAGELRTTLAAYMGPDGKAEADGIFGLAAPHVSPEGGFQSYRSAYGLLRPEHKERTFVILATSHYGPPEKFGLTRKPFVTPLGECATDVKLVDWLAEKGGDAVVMEDYCHSFEHTVELQLIFLQHALGPGVRIVPILCGSFADSLLNGGDPEDNDAVRRFFGALGELNDRESGRLLWVLGVDMAHMGERYQDPFEATAGTGLMQEVEERDRERIDRILAGDGPGFWELVRPNHDDLKWCGSAPIYTFLRSFPGLRGDLLRYEQWNIDDSSVVSFAGLSFVRS